MRSDYDESMDRFKKGLVVVITLESRIEPDVLQKGPVRRTSSQWLSHKVDTCSSTEVLQTLGVCNANKRHYIWIQAHKIHFKRN